MLSIGSMYDRVDPILTRKSASHIRTPNEAGLLPYPHYAFPGGVPGLDPNETSHEWMAFLPVLWAMSASEL